MRSWTANSACTLIEYILHIFHLMHILHFDDVCQIQTGRREHQGNSFDRKWLPSFRRQPVLVPPVLYPEAGLQYAGYEGADDIGM